MLASNRTSSRTPAARMFETLEGRTLMSASAVFNPATFTLHVTSNAASDSIQVNAFNRFGQQVVVNGQVVLTSAFNVKKVVVNGHGGDDRITVNLAVPTTINGGAGNDVIFGSSRADTIYGSFGNDRIDGRGGDDYLSGGSNDDVIIGGAGKDRMFGDDGNDIISARDGVSGEGISGGTGLDSATYDKKVLFLFGGDSVSGIEFSS